MDVFVLSTIWVPVLWILLQNLLIIYISLWLLRMMRLLSNPIAGLEYSQIVIGGTLLLTMVGLGNVSVQACYDTYLSFSSQPGPWIGKIILQYSRYFLVILIFEFLLVGLYWLTLKLFFGFRLVADQKIQEGNLPMAILMGGIVAGLGLGLTKLAGIIMGQMTPHFVLLNGLN